MAKKTTKRKTRKTVKARKVVRKRTVKARTVRKTVRARNVKRFQPSAVIRQPLTAIQNGVSSFIGYFK